MYRMRLVDRWFPAPRVLIPRTMGIDISDTSVKWLALDRAYDGAHMTHYGSTVLEHGVVEGGVIRDEGVLERVLRSIKTQVKGIGYVHVALPEEAAYVFSMHVPPGTPREQVLKLIEFEFEGRVPILPAASVYDYDVIKEDSEGSEIGVTVFPREVADVYLRVCAAAGFSVWSFEIGARSIARAALTDVSDEMVLLVDFGETRTSFAVVHASIPIFTSTIALGGADVTRAIMEASARTAEDAERFKNEQGILGVGEAEIGSKAANNVVQKLVDEVARHFHFWDTRRDERGARVTPVAKVVLVGGSSNIKGLTDSIATAVHAPVERASMLPRITCATCEIPPIDRKASLGYATTIGLALRTV